MRLLTSLLILLCFINGYLFSENQKSLNFSTHLVLRVRTNDVTKALQRGIYAFKVVDPGELPSILTICKIHLQTHPHAFYYLFTEQAPEHRLEQIKSQLYVHKSGKWPVESELTSRGKHFIIYEKMQTSDLAMNFSDYITGTDSLEKRESKAPDKDFIWYSLSKPDSLIERKLYDFWDYYAHPVNFILCDTSELAFMQSKVTELESESCVSGCFTFNGKILNNCYFKQNIHRAPINGFFCIPFKIDLRMMPVRAGVLFQPDVLYVDKVGATRFREIKAILPPLETSELVDVHFSGRTHIQKSAVQDSYLENVEFRKDTISGKRCAYFNGESNQISFSPGNITEEPLQFSASIRFLSTYNKGYHALVSQGKILSFKISGNRFIFTLPGRKDYVLRNLKLKENQWMHISFTIFQGRTLQVYDHENLVESVDIDEILCSNEKIQIGNNNSFEMFQGYLSDVRIWNRTLSEFDIISLQEKPNQWSVLCWLFIPVTLVILLFLRKRKKVAREALPTEEIPYTSIEKKKIRNSILFFDGLAVFNGDGENLATKMSPKIRFLFAVIALHSVKGGISTKDLTDIVWPGMSKEAAKNNRSTSIAILRELLLKIPTVQLVYEHKTWFLVYDHSVYVDYNRFQDLNTQFEQKEPMADEIRKYCSFIRGRFLKNVENEWSDDLKSRVHETALHHLEQFSNNQSVTNNPTLLLQLAHSIYAIEELNEEALELELRAVRSLNKPEKERTIIERFSKKHEAIYGIPYEK